MLGVARLKGIWHSSFENIYGINNYRGIQFISKNVKIDVKSCYLVHGDTSNIGDGGNSYGISIERDIANISSEDIKISRSIIYGYNRGVNIESILNGSIENCDIDYAGSYGIYMTLLDGGFSIKDNWIALTDNST